MSQDILETLRANRGRQFELHQKCVNPQMRRMLHLVGMDVDYVRSSGNYVYDVIGRKYLDLMTHSGVFSIGHNHPHVSEHLHAVLSGQVPHLLLMDCSLMSGLLAERLLQRTPHLQKAYFANSGAEAVETALKMARGSTNRPRIVYFEGAYHGLTYGALSVVGHEMWRAGFGPFLPGCTPVPFSDAQAVARELEKGDVACVLGETILGDGGAILPREGFWVEVADQCRRTGTLLVLDEIQVGMGRTGKFHAYEHYGVQPDMVLLGKALSGGQAPVAAVLMRDEIFDRVFSRVDRCCIHAGTFCENNLAMAAGLATLDVYETEELCAKSETMGRYFLKRLLPLKEKYELIHDIRGRGLMIGIELGRPKSSGLRVGWELVHRLNEGLCCQMVTLPLFRDHGILAQLGGHNFSVIKLMPPLQITQAEIDYTVSALDAVLAECHRFPGEIWTTIMGMAKRAIL